MSEPKHNDTLGKKWGVRRFQPNSVACLTKKLSSIKFSNANFHVIHGVNLTKPVREILEKYDK